MNIRSLSARQSRTMALSLLLAAVLCLVAIVAVPVFLLHRHYDQAIEQQLDLLARYSRIGATATSLAKQLETLKIKDTRRFFLKSPAPALAASEVQEVIKNMAEGHGAKVSSMQIPEHKDDGAYRKVTVSVQMSARISAVQRILYALETQHPYLILDNVSIRATSWQAQNNPGAPEAEFLVQFDAAGYAVLEAQ